MKPRVVSILWMRVAHRRGDSGCPYNAYLTGKTLPIGIFPNFLWFSLQMRCDLSIVAHSASASGSASTKKLSASDPQTLQFVRVTSDQNRRELDCSRPAAQALSRVTLPFMCGDPLNAHRDFLLPPGLKTCVQMSGRMLDLLGKDQGFPNTFWLEH